MIRPIDMQVQFQAMQDVARSTSAEQAGALYRNVADLGQARQNALIAQAQVQTAAQAQAPVFRPINREEQEDKRNRGDSGSSSANAAREKKLASSESQLYGVAGMRHIFRRATVEESTGKNLDLSA